VRLLRRQWAGALLLASLLLTPVWAGAPGPLQLVEQTSEAALTRLRQERPQLEQDPSRIYDLLEDLVLPHFDFVRISAWVLGRHWRAASPEQKRRFVRAFRTLLVRTYGVALLEYTGQEIRYLPLRDDPARGDVTVRTQVIGKRRHPIAIHYRLSNRQGEWKVYDVIIDGISLVANFRTSYAVEIKQKGLDALIARLEHLNVSPPPMKAPGRNESVRHE